MNENRNPFEGKNVPLPADLVSSGFEQRFVDLAGVTVSYVRGPVGGLPLVLVPAQMATWRTYAKVMPALAAHFEVFGIDVRGHGSSSWTTGDYSWDSAGGDLKEFIAQVVGRPAVISGNSSGGILALWCAANVPELTAAIVLEDAPVFSVEMPRFRDRDRFVYNGLRHAVEVLDDGGDRHLADYFRGQELPVSEKRSKRLPTWLIDRIDRAVLRYESNHPGEPSGVDVWWLPGSLHEVFHSLSMFDPDFARAFVDGRFYGDFSHAAALRETTCPVLLLHGRWHRFAEHGLVGAMDDDDARHVQELAPQTVYRKIEANHVLHRYKPKEFTTALIDFAGVVKTSRAGSA